MSRTQTDLRCIFLNGTLQVLRVEISTSQLLHICDPSISSIRWCLGGSPYFVSVTHPSAELDGGCVVAHVFLYGPFRAHMLSEPWMGHRGKHGPPPSIFLRPEVHGAFVLQCSGTCYPHKAKVCKQDHFNGLHWLIWG